MDHNGKRQRFPRQEVGSILVTEAVAALCGPNQAVPQLDIISGTSTAMELLDLIVKYIGIFVTAALGSGVGAYIDSYLRKKGENLATHEDIDKLVDQVAAVTTATKQIEANVSKTMWQRERKADLQLKLIDSVNTLTSQYLQSFIADPQHVPGLEWFTSFGATDAAVKALFDKDTYAAFKKLEILIGPAMGDDHEPLPALVASERFVEARDVALKAMYSRVIDS